MLTAAQLITYALQAAKAPGYTTQAADLLNARLSTMARRFDFDVLKKFGTINVMSGVQRYLLPSDYVRGLDCFYYIGGLPQTIGQIDLNQYNAMNAGNLSMAYPTKYATDPSTAGGNPPYIYFYPMPNTAFPMSLRYASQPPDIANPATSGTVPWFPDSALLLTLLTADICLLTDDTRADNLAASANAQLAAFLKMQGDKEGYVQTVKLGQSFQKQRNRLPASKLTGF
jgi:hypothetical protein